MDFLFLGGRLLPQSGAGWESQPRGSILAFDESWHAQNLSQLLPFFVSEPAASFCACMGYYIDVFVSRIR